MPQQPRKRYRLVTQPNLDGLACAVLLKERGLINEVNFTHPKDLHSKGSLSFTDDIVTGLPFVRGGHAKAEGGIPLNIRLMKLPNNFVVDTEAKSAARVLYRYLGESKSFPDFFAEMLDGVDHAGAAEYGADDIANPQGWTLLGFILDERTGLERFKDFRIGHEQLIVELIDVCRSEWIAEILKVPDVAERVEAYRECDAKFTAQLKERTQTVNGVGVIDLWETDTVFPGNRYRVYALFPDVRVSVQVLKGREPGTVNFSVGKSILNHDCAVHIGNMMARIAGGGGHANAGGCTVPRERGEGVLKELIQALTRNEA